MNEGESEIPEQDIQPEKPHRLHRAAEKLRGLVQKGDRALPYPDTDPYVWQDEPERETSLDEKGEVGLDELFDKLKSHESRAPHPRDLIALRGQLTEEERAQLLATEDITAYDVDEFRSVRREQLLAAGFVFLNRLGSGEKGIISGDFPDPDDPKTILNFENRTMLTREELAKVYAYQQQHPDVYGLHNQDLAEVRKDMISYLYSTEETHTSLLKPPDVTASLDLNYRILGTASDWEAVAAYLKVGVDQYVAAHTEKPNVQNEAYMMAVNQFAMEYCLDICASPQEDRGAFAGKDVRGHSVVLYPIRRDKLESRSTPSPFLESGYCFGDNPDVLISSMPDPDDPAEKIGMRMNMATIHLAGAHPDFPGFSEIGGKNDQVYMPVGVYVEELYPKDTAERKSVQQQESQVFKKGKSEYALYAEVQRRVIRRAREWQAEQSAPKKNKKRTWRRRQV